METHEGLLFWIENGRQIGTEFSFMNENGKCWSSVAIQKWEGRYKVYVDEIMESDMVAENFLRDEIRVFQSAESALCFMDESTRAESSKLRPCKGQKIFNPQFS